MATGVPEDFIQTESMLGMRRWIFTVWLSLTVAAALCGWWIGRREVDTETPTGGKIRAQRLSPGEVALATYSPKGKWAARVKAAASSDFPRLLEEWKILFPETEDSQEGQREHALRWLFAQWLVRDRENFVKSVTDKEFQYTHWAAQVIASLDADLAARLLSEANPFTSEEFLLKNLAEELAKNQPLAYLTLNGDGHRGFLRGSLGWGENWELAIISLSKTDPIAAANAWKKRKLENNHTQVLTALIPAFESWKDSDPPAAEWVSQIEDPELRELAEHARLIALARQDPHAALDQLYSAGLERNNNIIENAPGSILTELAKQDLPAALRLLRETSPLFGKSDEVFSREETSSDPFAETPLDPPKPPPSGPPPNPFVTFCNLNDSPEDNWMRSVILNEAASHLPNTPNEMIAALLRLRNAMGGDGPWQREVEAELMRKAAANLTVDSCLALAGLWNAELNGAADDKTYRSLAARAVATDPVQAEGVLDSLPETARAPFAAEIVKQLPPEENARRLALLDRLTPEQWDDELGQSLGEDATSFANAIAALPGSTTSGARQAFMKKWVQRDPDSAVRWFATLPNDDAKGPTALGIFNGWVEYDRSAALAWAEGLPDSPFKQAVALDAVGTLAEKAPREAWRWAASITDPKVRAWAYNTISSDRDDEPEAFRREHQAVLRAAGMD